MRNFFAFFNVAVFLFFLIVAFVLYFGGQILQAVWFLGLAILFDPTRVYTVYTIRSGVMKSDDKE